jgi:hypothetical protein
MRAVVAEMQEPRPPLATAQVGKPALGEPGGVRQLLGDACRPRRRAGAAPAFRQPDIFAILGQLEALIRHPAEIGILVRLEGADGAEALHDVAQHQEARIVGAGGARVWCRRGVADQRRIVAAAAQLVGQVGETRIERNRVLHRAVIHHVEPGQQAGTRRPAGRALGEMVAESHALGAQPVDVGQLEVIRPELGQHQAAPLVDDDQQDILAGRHAFSPFLAERPIALECRQTSGGDNTWHATRS